MVNESMGGTRRSVSSSDGGAQGRRPLSRAGSYCLLAIHWFIIANFLAEIVYASYMIFVVVAPEGGGPLFEAAKTFPFEQMATRRLYAIECWLAISGLSIYLAVTEIAPRLRRMRGG